MEDHKIQWLGECYETIFCSLLEIYQLKSLSETKEGKCLDLEQQVLKKNQVRSQLLELMKQVETYFQEMELHLETCDDKCSNLEQPLLKKDQLFAVLKSKMEFQIQNMESKEYSVLAHAHQFLEMHFSLLKIQEESPSPNEIKGLDLEQEAVKINRFMEKQINHMYLQFIVKHNKEVVTYFQDMEQQLEISDKKCLNLEEELLKKDKLLADLKQQMEVKENKCIDLERELLKNNIMFSRLEQQEVSSRMKYLNMKQQLVEKENMRLQLLDDLKNQEVSHLHKMEVKNNECSDLKQELLKNTEFVAVQKMQIEDYQQQSLEYERTRLQLLNDLKQQEETYLHESEARDRKVSELQQEIDIKKMNMYLQVSCSICLEERNTDDHRLVSLQCGHIFGDKCIQDCIQRYSKCPICSRPAALNDRRNIYCI